MTTLPNLNELGKLGCEVTVRARDIVWSGKTRLLSVDEEGVMIETKMGALRTIKREHVDYLSLRPAPRPNPPEGRMV